MSGTEEYKCYNFMESRRNWRPGPQLSNKSRRRGPKHVTSNILCGKSVNPGERGTDLQTIGACNKNILRQARLMVQTTRWLIDCSEACSLVSDIWGGERRSRNPSLSCVRVRVTGRLQREALSLRTLSEILGGEQEIDWFV